MSDDKTPDPQGWTARRDPEAQTPPARGPKDAPKPRPISDWASI
jgi:hypothetical protein